MLILVPASNPRAKVAAQSARSGRAQLVLEQGAEQMVYVGENVLELGPRYYEAEALATESAS
eukprot:COSAG06_NODE_41312_length_392_cov_1.873720_1_plen_62_part_00